MDQMDAAQCDFLDTERRWNADEKGDFKLLDGGASVETGL
jgi:hypothetical protein